MEEIVSQAQLPNSQSDSDSPSGDELEKLSSEAERNKRLITDLQSETSKLRNSIENLEALFAQTQAANVEGADYGLDDESEEEDEEWWGEEDEEESDDEGDNTLPSRLLQGSFSTISPGASPGIFPGARYYCTEEGCVFFDGSRQAWWWKWKAERHMDNTGHEVANV